MTCSKCHAEIEFNKDDVLTAHDGTEAFPKVYVSSLRCPYCNERTVLEYRDIDGKKTTAKITRIL